MIEQPTDLYPTVEGDTPQYKKNEIKKQILI